MEKGDKIIDKRDNTIHIVECVDVYDEVTLVFTESKKYIPVENLREFTMEDMMLDKKLVDMIKEKEKQRLIDECLKVLNTNFED